jgi:branched-chain amino acid transport system substrate-binding protein
VLHSLTSQLVCRIIATGSGYGNIFQVCPSDDSYGDEFLRFVKRVSRSGLVDEHRRDVVMLTDDPQMADYHRGWAERALRIGYDLTLLQATNETEAAQAARVITAASPALVFIACFRSSTLRSFLREFMRRPSPSLLYGLWAPGTSDFRNDLGEFEGLVWSTATGRYADALGKRFEQGFQNRFGRPVFGTSASIQYDSIGILAHAWQRSGRPDSYRATNEELRRLIHRGVNGSYFFGAEYQRPLAYGIESRDASLSQAHLVYQIQDGVNRIISPAPYASSRYRPQPWLRLPVPA